MTVYAGFAVLLTFLYAGLETLLSGVVAEHIDLAVVRNGKLYLIGRDELAVQRVYVFRIER